jgi:hypothetical protein
MNMVNCLKWAYEGQPYEACDFGSFVRVQVPGEDDGSAIRVDVSSAKSWKSKSQGAMTVVTVESRGTEPVTLTIPPFESTILLRWLERLEVA